MKQSKLFLILVSSPFIVGCSSIPSAYGTDDYYFNGAPWSIEEIENGSDNDHIGIKFNSYLYDFLGVVDKKSIIQTDNQVTFNAESNYFFPKNKEIIKFNNVTIRMVIIKNHSHYIYNIIDAKGSFIENTSDGSCEWIGNFKIKDYFYKDGYGTYKCSNGYEFTGYFNNNVKEYFLTEKIPGLGEIVVEKKMSANKNGTYYGKNTNGDITKFAYIDNILSGLVVLFNEDEFRVKFSNKDKIIYNYIFKAKIKKGEINKFCVSEDGIANYELNCDKNAKYLVIYNDKDKDNFSFELFDVRKKYDYININCGDNKDPD